MKADIAFAITSGRPPRGMKALIDDLQVRSPIAAFNCGLFVRPALSVLRRHVIPREPATSVIDILTRGGLDVWLYTDNDWYDVTGRMSIARCGAGSLRERSTGCWHRASSKRFRSPWYMSSGVTSVSGRVSRVGGGSVHVRAAGRRVRRAVLASALPAIRRIVAAHETQAVLVVSHKATIRLVIASLLSIDLRGYRDRLDQSLAWLNILAFTSPTQSRLTVFNDVSHYAETFW